MYLFIFKYNFDIFWHTLTETLSVSYIWSKPCNSMISFLQASGVFCWKTEEQHGATIKIVKAIFQYKRYKSLVKASYSLGL